MLVQEIPINYVRKFISENEKIVTLQILVYGWLQFVKDCDFVRRRDTCSWWMANEEKLIFDCNFN
jgi:hypothetical protein